jgi:hypothetical protein
MSALEKAKILLKDFNVLYTNMGLTESSTDTVPIRFVITTPHHTNVSNNIIKVENEIEYLEVIKCFIEELKPLNINYSIEDVRLFKKMSSYVFIQLCV